MRVSAFYLGFFLCFQLLGAATAFSATPEQEAAKRFVEAMLSVPDAGDLGTYRGPRWEHLHRASEAVHYYLGQAPMEAQREFRRALFLELVKHKLIVFSKVFDMGHHSEADPWMLTVESTIRLAAALDEIVSSNRDERSVRILAGVLQSEFLYDYELYADTLTKSFVYARAGARLFVSGMVDVADAHNRQAQYYQQLMNVAKEKPTELKDVLKKRAARPLKSYFDLWLQGIYQMTLLDLRLKKESIQRGVGWLKSKIARRALNAAACEKQLKPAAAAKDNARIEPHGLDDADAMELPEEDFLPLDEEDLATSSQKMR